MCVVGRGLTGTCRVAEKEENNGDVDMCLDIIYEMIIVWSSHVDILLYLGMLTSGVYLDVCSLLTMVAEELDKRIQTDTRTNNEETTCEL